MNVFLLSEQHQFDALCLESEFVTCIPLWQNNKHPSNNSIIAVAILGPKSLHIANLSHPDIPAIHDISAIFTVENVFIENKLDVMYHYPVSDSSRDLYVSEFMKTSSIGATLQSCITDYHKNVYNRVDSDTINNIIPIAKWIEALQVFSTKLDLYDFDKNEFYNMTVIPTLQWIESAGIHVNSDQFKKRFPQADVKDNLVFSDYNIFNLTGRPSNSYNGVNFLALNKSDGTRSAITSRYEDGVLLQFDFDAYHLRLLSNYWGISSGGDRSIHMNLAKYYYDTDEITKEMYDTSKQITFSVLYGNDSDGVDLHPFLRKIKDGERSMWQRYAALGYMTAPRSLRRIIVPDAKPAKVFNYFVQCLEFETTILKLKMLHRLLLNEPCKVILYTYDAILVDCSRADSERLRGIIEPVLERGNFPVNVSTGMTYDDLK